MSDLSVQERLDLQLSEIELLQSMFPGEGEFSIWDQSVLSDLRSFVDGDADASGVVEGLTPGDVPNDAADHDTAGAGSRLRQLSFVIKIVLTEGTALSSQVELQLHCDFPLEYPYTLPDLNVRSNSLSRQQYRQLNDDLLEHLQSLERGELCITEAVQWLQENAANYFISSTVETGNAGKTDSKKPSSFTRLWIHSHHIYSRSKRENIFEWSRERGLTGFSLPGKPGIICVEGQQQEVDEFWHKIRRLNWKKLTSKHREDFEVAPENFEAESKGLRHFQDFQEINFDVRGARDYHMDLGQFFQYLERHGCADIFKILLGVDGRVSQKDAH
ncbi:RWD domain-containing protein 2B-like [Diadema setosum]|uniref:RWD domain-containing protein 2B-like n=1 Tax=Diadema setosum TaxID=31175 RepID=UPI003B3B251E